MTCNDKSVQAIKNLIPRGRLKIYVQFLERAVEVTINNEKETRKRCSVIRKCAAATIITKLSIVVEHSERLPIKIRRIVARQFGLRGGIGFSRAVSVANWNGRHLKTNSKI